MLSAMAISAFIGQLSRHKQHLRGDPSDQSQTGHSILLTNTRTDTILVIGAGPATSRLREHTGIHKYSHMSMAIQMWFFVGLCATRSTTLCTSRDRPPQI